MPNLLIFLPEIEVKKWKGLIFGVIMKNGWGVSVYVLGNHCGRKCEYCPNYDTVGTIDSGRKYKRMYLRNIKNNPWISIILKDQRIDEVNVVSDELYVTTIILFQKQEVDRSQLLDTITFHKSDVVYRFLYEIRCTPVSCAVGVPILPYESVLNIILLGLKILILFLNNKRVKPLFMISSFGLHLQNVIMTAELLLSRVIETKKIDVQLVNYICARILDSAFGIALIFCIMSNTSLHHIVSSVSSFQENFVISLGNVVQWLMGSPAGFKLNYPLNNIFGMFYQFHTSMWGTFLKLSNPVLSIILKILIIMGIFGFSFQIAILADLLAIISVHIYCIYVYASKLYYFQLEGLKILSRLFIGKKRNPLPGKNNLFPYTTEQLLFGTVSFTILLFLLPTTLIYYLVFTAIWVMLIFLGGIFTRLRYLMIICPVYITWLWFFDYLPLTSTVRVNTNAFSLNDGTLVIKIKPVCRSWMDTVSLCIPKCVNRPRNIEWKKLTQDVLIGNLIYPV